MQLTPKQALETLDAAAAKAPLSRAEHVAVQQSTQLLAMLVQEYEASLQKPTAPAPEETPEE